MRKDFDGRLVNSIEVDLQRARPVAWRVLDAGIAVLMVVLAIMLVL